MSQSIYSIYNIYKYKKNIQKIYIEFLSYTKCQNTNMGIILNNMKTIWNDMEIILFNI